MRPCEYLNLQRAICRPPLATEVVTHYPKSSYKPILKAFQGMLQHLKNKQNNNPRTGGKANVCDLFWIASRQKQKLKLLLRAGGALHTHHIAHMAATRMECCGRLNYFQEACGQRKCKPEIWYENNALALQLHTWNHNRRCLFKRCYNLVQMPESTDTHWLHKLDLKLVSVFTTHSEVLLFGVN